MTKPDARNLIIVVRADPIICGHSTEARNLAEAAIRAGFDQVEIITYPIDMLMDSDLPLKPIEEVSPYSNGIRVHRPDPIGSYKVLDGRQLHGMSGRIVDLVAGWSGTTWIMDLYLVPHGRIVSQALDTLRYLRPATGVVSIAEAVGSDITDVVRNALKTGELGAAAMVLGNYLDHDVPVAVSQYTKDLIVEAGREVDEALRTRFAEQLAQRVGISYPAIDAGSYIDIANHPLELERTLLKRELVTDNYILFLSRLAPAKGADDLIRGYRASKFYGRLPLVIAGNGPHLAELREIAAGDPTIRFYTDVSDLEKPFLMHGARAFVLPSKPRQEFVETFGIAVAEQMLAGGGGIVITTQTGGIPEATGGHCLSIETDAPFDITQALDRVARMSHAERQARSRRAQQFALRFDREIVFDHLLQHGGRLAA